MATEEQLNTVKAERTNLKRKVTQAASRLNGAIARKCDATCVDQFMMEIERCLSDFVVCNDDYTSIINDNEAFAAHAVVNGLNLKQYEEEVMTQYNEAKYKYDEVKQQNSSQVSQNDNSIDVKMIQCQIDRLLNACIVKHRVQKRQSPLSCRARASLTKARNSLTS